MMKNFNNKTLLRASRMLLLALFLGLSMTAASVPARAACEPASAVPAIFPDMTNTDIQNLNLLIAQEVAAVDPNNVQSGGFAPNLMRSALKQLVNYFHDFAANIAKALTNWASKDWMKALQSMTMEIHASQVDQTLNIGRIMDAQQMVEEKSLYETKFADAHRRYTPSELACDIDATGPAASRAYQIARQLNRGLALDNMPRHANSYYSISAGGKGQELRATWFEYTKKFCDMPMGDLGCADDPAINLRGKNRDLGNLLWGEKQTIDPDNGDNMLTMQATLRYIVDPLAPDPIVMTGSNTVQGQRGLIDRRSELAYVNTIYNTLGGMLSERIGGSGMDVKILRVSSGVADQNASSSASYREIQEAMTRDRYTNPEYMVRMIGDPTQVMREQETLNALKMQTLNDVYRRTEEMLFMESAEYGRDLNEETPSAAIRDMPFTTAP